MSHRHQDESTTFGRQRAKRGFPSGFRFRLFAGTESGNPEPRKVFRRHKFEVFKSGCRIAAQCQFMASIEEWLEFSLSSFKQVLKIPPYFFVCLDAYLLDLGSGLWSELGGVLGVAEAGFHRCTS